MRSINFELSSAIKYADGNGSEIECNFIELREPTGRVTDTACAIEGMIQSSIMKSASLFDKEQIEAAQAQAPADPDQEKNGDAILSIIAAGDIDMKKLVLYFRELFKVVAFMGGEKPITEARMNDMSHQDLRKMIGVYAANFIMS